MMKNKLKPKKSLYLSNAKGNSEKILFALYTALPLFAVGIGIFSFTRENHKNVFICVIALALFLIPSLVKKLFSAYLPISLEILVLLFIFSSEILGEIFGFYLKIPMWDSLLHLVTGFLFAAVGFSLGDILERGKNHRFKIPPLYIAVAGFCFSMTVGCIWEFFEFSMDRFFGLDMQKDTALFSFGTVSLDLSKSNEVIKLENVTDVIITTAKGQRYNLSDYGIYGYLDTGITDTMKDLFVNMVGAAAFSFTGYHYLTDPRRAKFVKNFIPAVKEKKNKSK